MVAALGQAIAQRIGEPRYRLWFDGKTKFTWDECHFVVGVPNRFYQEWLQRTFAEEVAAAAEDILGMSMQVRFTIDPQLYQASRAAEADERPRGKPATQPDAAPSKH